MLYEGGFKGKFILDGELSEALKYAHIARHSHYKVR